MSKNGETFDVKFTHVNRSKNEGGDIGTEKNCLVKPVKENRMKRQMIGLQRGDGTLINIYLLALLEVRFGQRGRYTKLTMTR